MLMRMFSFAYILSMFSIASVTDAIADEYKSGKDLFRQVHASKSESLRHIRAETGGFVKVPVDPGRPQGRKTELYYQIKGVFNPSRPTIIEFDGGPGGSSHHPSIFPIDVNIISFDGRGIAFSRPEDEALYKDPNFYSSRNTAFDAIAILDHLNIKHVAAVGFSAGTIPALEFARLAPDMVSSVILVGPSFPQPGLDSKSDFLIGLLRDFLSEFPELIPFLNAVSRFNGDSSSFAKQASTWIDNFGSIWKEQLYAVLRKHADRWAAGVTIEELNLEQAQFNRIFQEPTPQSRLNVELDLDPWVLYMLIQKEAGGLVGKKTIHLSDGYLYLESDISYEKLVSKSILETSPGITDVWTRPTKIDVPVYLISGTDDWRTTYTRARLAYELLQAPRKTLITVSGGTHCELGYEYCNFELRTDGIKKLWHSMIHGRKTSVGNIQMLNNLPGRQIVVETNYHGWKKSCPQILGADNDELY